MKYRDPVTGEFKEISVKAGDTLPIGTVVEYEGTTIPDGYEEVEDDVKVLLSNTIYSATGQYTINDISKYDFILVCASGADSNTATNTLLIPTDIAINRGFCISNLQSPTVYYTISFSFAKSTTLNVSNLSGAGWTAPRITQIYGIKL